MRSKAATDNPLEKSLRLCYYLYRQLSIDHSRFICGKAYTMDLIQIDENGLHLVFEKTEDFGCKLLHFSCAPL